MAHQGKYICGYCKKETPLEDDLLIDLIDGRKELSGLNPLCDCGHFSYCSSIRFKAGLDPKDWKFSIGSFK